ncbi:MAG: condensation domain-containing protein, partial [Acidobacteria bacterium]|nr:condensation domain-containing protein [Acidobacteriota bacterium]
MTEVWKEMLGLESVGVRDNFFELGGDSIVSIQVVARARKAGIEITPRQIFQYQTIAELAEAAVSAGPSQAEQGAVVGEVPLTPIQHWFFEQRFPNRNHFNQAVTFKVKSEIDPGRLRRVVDKLLEHHDALRMRFVEEAGGWRQYNLEREDRRVFSEIDLSESGDAWGSGLEQAARQVQESLDLSEGPLMRVVLYQHGQQQRLQVVIHHLVVDGVSWRVLLEDLQRGYEQLARGEEIEFPAKTTSFRRWAERQREYALRESMEEEKAYWLSEGWGDVGRLPVDNRGGNNREKDARLVMKELSGEETEELLKRVPEVYHTQINDVLLTALVRGYRRWSGERRLVVDLEGHGREALSEEEDVSRTVGWFTTIAPVRLEAGVKGEIGEDLKKIKEELRGVPGRGIGYGMLRFLADEASREQARKIKAEVGFNYLGQFDQVLEEGGMLSAAGESGGSGVSGEAERGHALEVSGSVAGGRLRLGVSYSEGMYERERIEELASLYLEELRGIIAHCREEGVGGYTPSDFDLVKLSQEGVDWVTGGRNKQIEDIYGLAPVQEGLLFHTVYRPEAAEYFEQLTCRMAEVEVESFKRAWDKVLERHAALRTEFHWEGVGQAVQVVRKKVSLEWEECDWRGLGKEEQRRK